MDHQTKAIQLRTQALALLEQASALDGLKPFSVTHRHNFGASTYMVWATDVPDKETAAEILDAEFEPDKGEELIIEENLTLEEVTGVAVSAQLLPHAVLG